MENNDEAEIFGPSSVEQKQHRKQLEVLLMRILFSTHKASRVSHKSSWIINGFPAIIRRSFTIEF